MNWNDFEKLCYDYLTSLNIEDVNFSLSGGSNSTLSDIGVFKNNDFIYNIEVKMPSSQACQFVVTEDKEKFIYSQKNKVLSEKKYCQPIIDIMNKNFDKYKNVKQTSIKIPCEEEILTKRFVSYYRNIKKTEYLISYIKNEFLIFRIDDVSNFFDLECVLRRKKSGSRNIPKKYLNEIINKIKEKISLNDNDFRFDYEKDKLYLYLVNKQNNSQFDAYKINDELYTYYFSKIDENKFEIRILSKTNNPNVLLNLTIKDNHKKTQINEFIYELEHL